MNRRIAGLACAAVLALSPSAAVAADKPVLRVIVVQASDVAAYVRELDLVRAAWQKHNVPATLTVYRASYAGPETGTVIVEARFPSMLALAQGMELARSEPEIVAEMAKLVPLRKVLSDSLYDELSH